MCKFEKEATESRIAVEKEQLRRRIADLEAAVAMRKQKAARGKVTGDGQLDIDSKTTEMEEGNLTGTRTPTPMVKATNMTQAAACGTEAISVQKQQLRHQILDATIVLFDQQCTQALNAASNARSHAMLHASAWVRELLGPAAAESMQAAGSLAYAGAVPWSDIDCSVHVTGNPTITIDIPKAWISYPTHITAHGSLLRLTGPSNRPMKAKNGNYLNPKYPGRIPLNCHIDIWLEDRGSADALGEQRRRALAMGELVRTDARLPVLLRALKGALWYNYTQAHKSYIDDKDQAGREMRA